MTLQSLYLKPGYWRVTEESTYIHRCFSNELCLGGADLNNTCLEGHTGPYCEVCEEGYAKSQGSCVKCSGDQNFTLVVGTLTIIITLVILVVACLHVDEIPEMSVDQAQTWGKQVKKFFSRGKSFLTSGKVQAKIVASYFQIATSLAFNFNLVLPFQFSELMKYFSFVNFDFGSLLPIGCMEAFTPFDHISNVYGITIISLVIMMLLFFASSVASKLENKTNTTKVNPKEERPRSDSQRDDKQTNEGKKAVAWSSTLFNGLLIFTFLILPTVSTKILTLSGCREEIDNDGIINDHREGYYLKIDKSIRCHSFSEPDRLGTNPRFATAWLYSLFMGIVFILGIPAWYSVLLWRQRARLDPGQDALVGQRSAKHYDKVSKSWEFMDHKPNPRKEVQLFGFTFEIAPKNRWAKIEPDREYYETLASKKEWIAIESMSEDEAMLCALYHRKKLEEKHPDLKRLSFLYEAYEPHCWAFEVNLDDENYQDKSMFDKVLAFMQLIIVALILFQTLQRKKLKEDGSDEEDISIMGTLKENIPGVQAIMDKLENATSCLQCYKISPEELFPSMSRPSVILRTMDMGAQELEVALELVKKASDVASTMQDKMVEFIKQKGTEFKVTYEDARDEEIRVLKYEKGEEDSFTLMQAGHKSGKKALLNLFTATKREYDFSAQANAVKDEVVDIAEEQLDSSKEELKEMTVNWVKNEVQEEIEKLLDNNKTIREFSKSMTVVKKLERKVVSLVQKMTGVAVDLVVGGAFDAIFSALSDPSEAVRKVTAINKEGIKDRVRSLGQQGVEGMKNLATEEVEEAKVAGIEELKGHIDENLKNTLIQLVDNTTEMKNIIVENTEEIIEEAKGIYRGKEIEQEGGKDTSKVKASKVDDVREGTSLNDTGMLIE
ncbi:hypothetical protein TrCOL_g5693 [Triparma columacea]|uniref:Laminin EGF-like domain-containing protein n=1 Tax=Triparma columacea TaxID=722753 RepID=A0A9W7LG55_9STRA|nr:hypothetical protein TrCOL_g5693 [Triparma columacea]